MERIVSSCNFTSPSQYSKRAAFRSIKYTRRRMSDSNPAGLLVCTNCSSKYFPHFSQTKHGGQQCSLDCRTMHMLRKAPLRRFIQTDQNNRIAPRAMRPPSLKTGNRLLESNDAIAFSCRVTKEQNINNVSGNLFSLLKCSTAVTHRTTHS